MTDSYLDLKIPSTSLEYRIYFTKYQRFGYLAESQLLQLLWCWFVAAVRGSVVAISVCVGVVVVVVVVTVFVLLANLADVCIVCCYRFVLWLLS